MSNAETIVFYLVSFIAIFGAFLAIFSVKNLASLLNAFICFASVGILFFALELPILGTVQILIVAIGLTVLFATLHLLTTKKTDFEELYNKVSFQKGLISVFIVAFVIFIISIFIKFGSFFSDGMSESCIMPATKEIAVEMFINYVFPFVFTGLFFLAAILGLGFLTSDIRSKKGRDS